MKKVLRVMLCFLLFSSVAIPATNPAGANLQATPPAWQEVPSGGTIIELRLVLSGLSSPLLLTNAGDGSKRLFVVEQGGIIKVLQPGSSSPTIFLNITGKVLSGGERGLLGLAFHPQYSTNGRLFVNYTRQPDGATVIAEYLAAPPNSNTADPNSERILLVIPQPFSNHNGGHMDFGRDGYLYIGLGDGGSGNDPGNRAQNIEELLGKMLRIDVDTPNGAVPYSSPSDNPYFGESVPGRDEIYAIGLRNPWRWSFDRGTGQLYAGDVGQSAWEEIDIITRGGNYGWRVMEGNHCNPNIDGGVCTPIGIPPIAEYSSASPSSRCSVTGGYVYRGVRSSLPFGAYIFGDFCTGEIIMLREGVQTLLLDTSLNLSSFGEDESGELYVVGIGGIVQRIVNPTPVPRNTLGVFRPSNNTFYLRNSNTQGIADISVTYGAPEDIPLVGDWDGDGTTTIGVFRPSNNTFYLRNSNTVGIANLTIPYGVAGDTPIAGDWDGDGTQTIAVYRSSEATFYLRNSNTAGFAQLVLSYGASGDMPVTGKWNDL